MVTRACVSARSLASRRLGRAPAFGLPMALAVRLQAARSLCRLSVHCRLLGFIIGPCRMCLSVWSVDESVCRVCRVCLFWYMRMRRACVPVYNYLRLLQSRRVGRKLGRGRRRVAARRSALRAGRARGSHTHCTHGCLIVLRFEQYLIFHNSCYLAPDQSGRTARRPPARAAADATDTDADSRAHAYQIIPPTLGPRGNQDRWLPLVLLAVL